MIPSSLYNVALRNVHSWVDMQTIQIVKKGASALNEKPSQNCKKSSSPSMREDWSLNVTTSPLGKHSYSDFRRKIISILISLFSQKRKSTQSTEGCMHTLQGTHSTPRANSIHTTTRKALQLIPVLQSGKYCATSSCSYKAILITMRYFSELRIQTHVHTHIRNLCSLWWKQLQHEVSSISPC